MPITSQLVKDFYAAAMKQYKAEIISKEDSGLMKLIAGFLDGIGVLNKDDFMKRFTTTIGSKIYCPFEVGVDQGYDLWRQISVLVHELTHVQQYDESPAEFVLKYLLYKSDRATYEAVAYASDLEMHWWMYGNGYDVKQRAQSLLSYGLKQEHCDYASEYLAIYDDIFRQGGGVSPVAAWAKEWLNLHGAK
jgi:hypothetical protein